MSIAPVVCCSLLLAVAPASVQAQAGPCERGTALTLYAGLAQSDHVDATASPFQFRGRGLDRSVGLSHSMGRWCFVAGARYDSKTMSPVQGVSGVGLERLHEGDAGVTLTRIVAGGRDENGGSLAIGAALRGAVEITDHSYVDPVEVTSEFRFDALSLGPAVQWREPLGSRFGAAVLEVSSAAVGLADHPYGAVWTHDASPELHVVSVGTLRTLTGSLSYSSAPWRGLRLTARYGVDGTRYDDVHPLRSLTQALSFGLVLPLDEAKR